MSLTNLSVISWNLITNTMFLAENALKIIYQLLGVGSFDQFGPGDWGQRWHVASGLESMKLSFHRYLSKSRDLPGTWGRLPSSDRHLHQLWPSLSCPVVSEKNPQPLGSLLPCEGVGITVRKTGHLFQPGLLSSGGTFNSSDSTE